MSAPALRPYQADVVEEFHRRIAAGRRRLMVVMPTGSGKTIVAGHIIRTMASVSHPVLVLAHRREIITHTSRKLYDLDIPHGIIMAGTPARRWEPVQVAAVQTLHRRGIRDLGMEMPPAGLLVIDEAHHCPASTYQDIVDAYPDAVLLGLTATPCRGDGRGLGGIFEEIVEAPQVAELIEQKHLVPTRCYAPIDPNLKGVRTTAGDYNEGQLADRMDRPQLVGDIVTHWHKFGERRRTVCFAVNVQHSIHIRDEFLKSGVRAEHIDGSTPKAERDATLARLSGEIDLVTNCMVLTEGWDCPEIGTIILARPTRKMGLYRQMIGRVLRPAPGKTDAIVLDHSGAVFRHGFVEDPVDWTLDPERRAENRTHEARGREGTASRLLECSQCGAVRVAGEACGACGFLPQRPPKATHFHDGDLAEVGRDRRVNGNVYDPATRAMWHAMFVHVAAERGYKPGWAAYKFKEKFGAWPPRGVSPASIPPTPEVRSWVRSRAIAYAKARAA